MTSSEAKGGHLLRYDLRVDPKSREKDRQMVLQRCYELGWDCIAWNVSTRGKVNSSSIAHLKPVADVYLDVVQLREATMKRRLVTPEGKFRGEKSSSTSSSKANLKALRQMSRLTIYVDEVVDAQTLTLSNESLRKFDLIAACPGNGKVFSFLCSTAEVDIITLEFSHNLSFPLHKKLLDAAIARGITFEICYSGMYSTSTSVRKEIINGTSELLQYLNGRNVILSSGAGSVCGLRGHMDAANIGVVLGLSKRDAEGASCGNCARTLQKAVQRKLGHLPLEIISSVEFEQRWPEKTMKDSLVSSVSASTEKVSRPGETKRKAGADDDEEEGNKDGGDNTNNKRAKIKARSEEHENNDSFLSF